jgi:hypothetical protein
MTQNLFEANKQIALQERPLIIRAGYDIAFDCYQEVPMVVLLSVHPSRQKDLRSDETRLRYRRESSPARGSIRLAIPGPGLWHLPAGSKFATTS